MSADSMPQGMMVPDRGYTYKCSAINKEQLACHLEGQSHKWRSTENNRTNTSREGDPRKKDAMAWSCHENGRSTHSETSAAPGSCRIQEKTWQTKDELERCGKEGPPKNGINPGRGWNISLRQTFVASTCGPMHRWCSMNQGQVCKWW